MSLPYYRELLMVAAATDFQSNQSYVLDAIRDWWTALKNWEDAETFSRAFGEGRMSVRTIRYDQVHGQGSFPLQMIRQAEPEKGKQEMPGISNTGIKGLQKRFAPANFGVTQVMNQYVLSESKKYEAGLHDMSVSLLHPKRLISHQLYGYGFQTDARKINTNEEGDVVDSSTYVVFMPLPMPEDLSLFIVLSQKAKEMQSVAPAIHRLVRVIRSELTRVKFADPDDSHIGFAEISPNVCFDIEQRKYRYGIKQADVETVAGRYSGELARRRAAARQYTSILETAFERSLRLGDASKARSNKFYNEIIVAYRKHASDAFPIYTRWDTGKFRVVMDSGNFMSDDVNKTITDKGVCSWE